MLINKYMEYGNCTVSRMICILCKREGKGKRNTKINVIFFSWTVQSNLIKQERVLEQFNNKIQATNYQSTKNSKRSQTENTIRELPNLTKILNYTYYCYNFLLHKKHEVSKLEFDSWAKIFNNFLNLKKMQR